MSDLTLNTFIKNFQINKMNADRYEQMKNAGTLPPNSLILTPDNMPDTKAELNASNLTNANVESWKEKLDVNTKQTKSKVIYNMSSSDSSLNLGYTSGVGNGIGLNLPISANAKCLKILLGWYGNQWTVLMNLQVFSLSSERYACIITKKDSSSNYVDEIIVLNSTKTTLTTYFKDNYVKIQMIEELYWYENRN